jgi:hypothetical protein
MPDATEKSDRFKPSMPRIPGVTDNPAEPEIESHASLEIPTARLAVWLGAALVLGALVVWWALRPAGPALGTTLGVSPPYPPAAVPAPVGGTPVYGSVEVASLQELAQPWSSKKFLFHKRSSGENIPAIVVRLPGGQSGRSASFWAFSLQAPFGRCELEYITDLARLAREYGYQARHPMVTDACNGAIYDPLRLGTLPSGAWARGEVVKGAGIRPPVAIEVRVQGKQVVALRSE